MNYKYRVIKNGYRLNKYTPQWYNEKQKRWEDFIEAEYDFGMVLPKIIRYCFKKNAIKFIEEEADDFLDSSPYDKGKTVYES